MSVAYRQTISDEMAARIERRRGLLSVQEYHDRARRCSRHANALRVAAADQRAAGVAHSRARPRQSPRRICYHSSPRADVLDKVRRLRREA